MDKLPTDASRGNTPATRAEARREFRRGLENEIIGNKPDRIQLNDIMLALLVIIAAAISFTDFTLSLGSLRDFTALSIFLYAITTMVYRNRYEKGKQRGKKDGDYCQSLKVYRQKRQEIYDKSLAGLVPAFCKDYKIKELREYRENLLADIEMDYEEYKAHYHRKSFFSIMRLDFSLEVKKILLRCNNAKPLRLVPGLLLNENGEMDREKLIGQSGRERERRDKKHQLVQRGVMVLFGSAIAINIILDFSVIAIFQWVIRMVPVISAIIFGDDAGYCNITVTETNFKRDQVSVINLFHEYLQKEHHGNEHKIEPESTVNEQV